MSALFARLVAILALTPAADQTGKEGYLVTIAGDTATVNASATVAAKGVILEGDDVDGKSSVGILGGNIGPCRAKAGGAITKGDLIAQKNDGTVITDPAAGARVVVGMANEDAVADELFEVTFFTPITYAA